MKMYTWVDYRVGVDYVVFAESEIAAKDFLCNKYKVDELEQLLFKYPPLIKDMPAGVIVFDSNRTKWLTN